MTSEATGEGSGTTSKNGNPDSSHHTRLARLGAWAGILGPTLFVVTFTVEGCLRPGYASARMFVSALSLGPRGWIQVLNFVVVGLSFLALARRPPS